MRVIPPITIDTELTSSTVYDVAPDGAYAGGTTYDADDIVHVASGSTGLIYLYKSLQGSNTGNTPDSTPGDNAWWEYIGSSYLEYNAGTTYAVGDYAIDNTNHLVYQSLVGGESGNALTNTTKWEEIGPTNKWAMFDLLRNTQTVAPNEIVVVLTPGQRTNSIAFSGLIADSYTLTVTSATYGGTIFSESGELRSRDTATWYEYFFGEFEYQNSVVFFNVPPYLDSVYTLTLTGASVSVGAVVLGVYVDIGRTLHTASSDVLNFSTIERDADGKATLTARRNVPKTRQRVIQTKNKLDRVRQAREDLNATPAFWFGINDSSDGYFEALSMLGIYKGWTISIDYPQEFHSIIELEEL